MDVESILKIKTVTSIDREYLKELSNEVKKNTTCIILDILAHFIKYYGQVTSETVDKENAKVKALYWNIKDSPVTVYNAIEDMVETSRTADPPKTPAQMVNYGLDIIHNTSDSERQPTKWFNLLASDRIWVDFKVYFTNTQREIKIFRGKYIRNTPLHQENLMSEQLTTQFEHMRGDVLTEVNALIQQVPAANYALPPIAPYPVPG